jgi:predicted PurR-regulated permease PerM
MDYLTNRRLQEALPLFKFMAACLIVIAVTAILYVGKEVLIHIALAVLLSFVLGPLVTVQLRHGVPRGLAVAVAVFGALAVILGLIAVVTWQTTLLAEQLPQYQDTILRKVEALSANLKEEGVFSRAADVVERVVASLSGAAPQTGATQQVVVEGASDATSRFGVAWLVVGPLLHPVATLFVVILLSFFILMQREDLRNRFIRLMGTEEIQQTTFAMDDAGRRVSSLLLSQLAVNAGFGVLIGLGLMLIGVPSALLWGIFAGVMRFVPYIGAFIGVVPPLIAAFAFDPTWSSFIWTGVLFLVVEPIIGHILEPWLYGKRVGLSPVAIIVCATVWAALWGPIGLILATPMTVCLVVMGRHLKRLAFLDVALGDTPSLTPQEIFYQRMLAGDPDEAISTAGSFLKRKSKLAYFDRIVMEALRRGHVDLQRDLLNEKQKDAFRASLGRFVSAIESEGRLPTFWRNRNKMALAEHDATLQTLGDDVDRGATQPSSQVFRVAVLYGNDPLDEIAADMLSQVLVQAGQVVQRSTLTGNDAAMDADQPAFDVVMLCHLEPVSTLQLRVQITAVRKCLGEVAVVLCIWQKTDADIRETLQKKVRADFIATSLHEAAAFMLRHAPRHSLQVEAKPSRQATARLKVRS